MGIAAALLAASQPAAPLPALLPTPQPSPVLAPAAGSAFPSSYPNPSESPAPPHISPSACSAATSNFVYHGVHKEDRWIWRIWHYNANNFIDKLTFNVIYSNWPKKVKSPPENTNLGLSLTLTCSESAVGACA